MESQLIGFRLRICKYSHIIVNKCICFFQKNHAEGRRKELAISVSNYRLELNKPIYKDAVKNYSDKMIDLQVRIIVINLVFINFNLLRYICM